MKVRVLCCVALSASVKVPLPLIALAKLSLMSVVTWFMVGPQWKLVSTCPADCLKTLLITWLPKKGWGLFIVDEFKADSKHGYAPPLNSVSALFSLLLIHSANSVASLGCFVLLNTAVEDPPQLLLMLCPACHCGRSAARHLPEACGAFCSKTPAPHAAPIQVAIAPVCRSWYQPLVKSGS